VKIQHIYGAGSTRIRASLFVFFRCCFNCHLTTRVLIPHECMWIKINFVRWISTLVANCTILLVDSTIMRVKSTRKVFYFDRHWGTGGTPTESTRKFLQCKIAVSMHVPVQNLPPFYPMWYEIRPRKIQLLCTEHNSISQIIKLQYKTSKLPKFQN
jgi:hypothetical protein